MARIIDGVILYNELDMLELRLRTLDSAVDYFVICEANRTHSGQPKPFYLADNPVALSRFEPWLPRMVLVRADLRMVSGSWERERQHRRELGAGIRLVAEPGDLVVVADIDEIPRPSALKQVNPTVGARLELEMFYFNARTRVRQGWSIGCIPFDADADANDVRTLAGKDVPTIDRAGWHFSYFMTPAQIVDKLNAFMHHADIAAPVPRDETYIQQCITQARDLYVGRGVVLETVPLAEDLPRALLTDAKYADWR